MMPSHVENGKEMEVVVNVNETHMEVFEPLNPHLGNLKVILNSTSSNCAYN
jgi:hypothetical protein